MSVQPFNNFQMADDFFNVFLHTSDSINNSASSPRWNLPVTGQMNDRYKFYKKCIAVVNYVNVPITAGGGGGVVAGGQYHIRDISNTQSNSADTQINQQSNIIYSFQVDTNVLTSNNGFPYLVVNPFGTQEFSITGATSTTASTSITNHWGIHLTYYFYY